MTMFRTKADMAERLTVWTLLAIAVAAFWLGVSWVVINHFDWVVRGFIGLSLLAICTQFWRKADGFTAKAVSSVLTGLVGYVALSVLGVIQ